MKWTLKKWLLNQINTYLIEIVIVVISLLVVLVISLFNINTITSDDVKSLSEFILTFILALVGIAISVKSLYEPNLKDENIKKALRLYINSIIFLSVICLITYVLGMLGTNEAFSYILLFINGIISVYCVTRTVLFIKQVQ